MPGRNTAATTVVVFLMAVALCAPAARADTMEADAVLPGMSIFQTTPDGEEASCTAGFVVTASDGKKAFLTAGHCAVSSGLVSMQYMPTHERRPVGTYRASVQDDDHDIGLVGVASPRVPVNPRVRGIKPVVDMAGPAELSGNTTTAICIMGARSQTTCGRSIKIVGNQLWFTAPAVHGDSGAPVFAVRDDGALTAIGILVSHPGGDQSITAAEFIEPWMRRWGLRLN
ncbi:hypothetical protein I3U40_08025 [Mycobacteroides abscessus subsp. abscessus]|uniref:hypothetical protein n=1 Tax=Mycobacteroides abscessus TaxID=36809 RepID=UPI0019CFA486|nr:hypothetical protein [Mycobacteroides abscessus]QSM95680.1 hypothetical protein I3U31_08015 [Mycobacteroides abscessus subsp. abscessus]QSN00713.1 hypothetical protein I3U40_08025 [Mycobacteroides abscessus subsp. abscessus]